MLLAVLQLPPKEIQGLKLQQGVRDKETLLLTACPPAGVCELRELLSFLTPLTALLAELNTD